MAISGTENPSMSSLKSAMRSLTATVTRIVALGLTAVMVLTSGLYSSRIMINTGSRISTDAYGPWIHWRHAGQADADPYTRAHIVKNGILQLSSDAAGVFQANTDSFGAYLHSSCDYLIEGPYAAGMWWSISIFDQRGKLIANDAARYAFTSDTVAANPDGSYIITLGRDARPGNWLPTGGAGRLALVFTILDPATGLSEEERGGRHKLTPTIRRENCS